ncbi:XRE family transcriptional regulator [Candidatus Methylomirabilis lanthanidiphila]|uniref:site-specific DNA-methyltransferase (adenine-specific) n=1 Tax=Candidatus Methylomirabilis lanthanidiphila TaxID=2211376 RepID=A0A564ZEZ2_9BACT|nr:type I restriction-modification system subunit M [Candidatus Methylomirabilis lanthanidiphila]VUZ83733.1 XRE family transcriptional regulator [Candidatus Methylomirabilis lanthanidiphila]
MAKNMSQKEINEILWRACDTFRGTLDPTQYKDYILVMLFLKYMSDLWKDKRDQCRERYKGDEKRVERALSRERFIMPVVELKDRDGKVEESFPATFDNLYERRTRSNIGELVNIALEAIEDANKAKLENVFRNIDFNSEPNLGQTKDRNRRLNHLLEDFAKPELDLRQSRIGNQDIIGNAYEYLISRFAADSGKKGGEFYTPGEVATLLAKLLNAQPGETICDPACGSGSLLIRVAKEVGSSNFALYGQESNGSTWALCRMNMFLHEMDNARIEWCNTITSPSLVEGDSLMKFNVVVANPPFSLDKWGQDFAENDPYNRFWRGIPPESKGDYAFISHMIETAIEGDGRVGVIVPHGVLFRGGAEGKIRQKLIEGNLLEAVIGLPANLFFGTGIPAAIVIYNRARKPWGQARAHRDKHVLFIDASREYQDDKNQSRLRPQDIDKIVEVFGAFKAVDKYAYPATLEEVQENDFNLNIPRYVDTFEPEPDVDIPAVQKEIADLEAELVTVETALAGYLKELGL